MGIGVLVVGEVNPLESGKRRQDQEPIGPSNESIEPLEGTLSYGRMGCIVSGREEGKGHGCLEGNRLDISLVNATM